MPTAASCPATARASCTVDGVSDTASTVEKPSGLPQAASERRAAAGSGARDQCGLRWRTVPVCGSLDATTYGPVDTGACPYFAPVSASRGTGLLDGSAST